MAVQELMAPPEVRSIPTFGRLWPDEFLDPEEGNFDVLLEKLEWLFERLRQDPPVRAGRRDLDPWFRYGEELAGRQVSRRSRSFEEAADLSLRAFEGCIRWHDPRALFNITPSPLLDTVALTALTALYNPNAIWDMTSGRFLMLEKLVARYLAQLVGWDPEAGGGVFTYGGKGTLFYAIKAGLNRCDRESVRHGLRGEYVVIAGESCHFSVESLCNYTGLGQRNCLRVPTTESGTIDLGALRRTVEEQVRRGRKIACILLSGGGTMNLSIDPVRPVAALLDEVVQRFDLPYRPYLHADNVISWVWLFVRPDLDAEALGIDEEVAGRLRRTARAVRETFHADSFGVDFHKTGLSPYSSSCFVCKDRGELLNLNSPEMQDGEEEWFGDARNFERTLENSRPCMGILSAYHVLERLGVEGFQQYLAYSVSVCEEFRRAIAEDFADTFEVVNTQTLGFEVVVKVHFFGDQRSYDEVCTAEEADREEYRRLCDEFFEFVSFGPECNGRDVPFIGYVPRYKFGNQRGGYPAFLLYPVSVHITAEDVAAILRDVAEAVRLFEEAKEDGSFVPRKVLDGVKPPPK
jgi:glutamate/tyrosine decarboxylase-like PLP-dependent enzyme